MDCALTTCKPTEHRSHTTSAITLSTRPVQAFTPTSHSSPLFRPSTCDNHVAFPRESTTAFWFPHSNTAESKCCNHNPRTTPTLLQPMPACATAVYVAYTMRARADMNAVQCLLTLASGHALRSAHMQCNGVQSHTSDAEPFQRPPRCKCGCHLKPTRNNTAAHQTPNFATPYPAIYTLTCP